MLLAYRKADAINNLYGRDELVVSSRELLIGTDITFPLYFYFIHFFKEAKKNTEPNNACALDECTVSCLEALTVIL
jgi:hypothetical protein